jgi:DNA-binding transcriptional regulator GbsR (MarR family)
MKPAALDRFVEAWGAMGALWGINRSVARVHALLMGSEEPLSLDEIARRLGISRGNASMSLRELRNFGVIRQVRRRGDRRDFYVTEPDVWAMFFRILGERKKREFDPALATVRGLLGEAGASGPVKERLQGMAELMAALEGVAARFLADPQAARGALALMAGLPPGGGLASMLGGPAAGAAGAPGTGPAAALSRGRRRA